MQRIAPAYALTRIGQRATVGAMTRLRFEPSGKEIDVSKGARFIDITDAHPDAQVPYACRSASCGTCRVEVVEGLGAMAAADDDELEVLEAFGNEKDVRLCCQLRLAEDVERVVLRVVEP